MERDREGEGRNEQKRGDYGESREIVERVNRNDTMKGREDRETWRRIW